MPANLARSVTDALRAEGRVVRSYIGVIVQPLDAGLAEAFKLKENAGALVSDVAPGSPAEKAGIGNGDVIAAVNGAPVRDSSQLRMLISSMKPGTRVTLDIVRGGAARSVDVVLQELPGDRAVGQSDSGGQVEDVPNALDGVTVDEISPETRRRLDIPREIEGALVTEVDPDSAAAEAGVSPGDVIQEIDRKQVAGADEAVALSRKIRKGDNVLLRVFSRGGTRYLVLKDNGQ